MSSMQLKDIRLRSLAFEINPNFDESEAPQAFGFAIKVNGDSPLDSGQKDVRVEVCAQIPGEKEKANIPFFIKIIYAGFFKFSDDFTKENIESFIRVNCPAIIFPYLRETVADVTRRAGFPPLHLPPVNFIKLSDKNSTIKKTKVPKKAHKKQITK